MRLCVDRICLLVFQQTQQKKLNDELSTLVARKNG